MWQPRTVWTKTFICFYRDVPTSDGLVILSTNVIGRKRLPEAPVLVSTSDAWAPKPVGRVTFLNEANDGSVWSTVELDIDPSTLPAGLYPEVDFSRPVDVTTRFGVATHLYDFLGMHLGANPAWPDLEPVT